MGEPSYRMSTYVYDIRKQISERRKRVIYLITMSMGYGQVL